jgi:hypothetical protein
VRMEVAVRQRNHMSARSQPRQDLSSIESEGYLDEARRFDVKDDDLCCSAH